MIKKQINLTCQIIYRGKFWVKNETKWVPRKKRTFGYHYRQICFSRFLLAHTFGRSLVKGLSNLMAGTLRGLAPGGPSSSELSPESTLIERNYKLLKLLFAGTLCIQKKKYTKILTNLISKAGWQRNFGFLVLLAVKAF